MNENKQAAAKREEREMEFVPHGGNDKIKLTIQIVQKLVAVRTKSGQTCSEQDALKFMMLCHGQRLNPFAGDAFLIGFDRRDGTAQFQQVTAHQAYLKRAELNPQFDGFRSGLTIEGAEGLTDIEGEIMPDDAELKGAWCEVSLKNRKVPMRKRIPLSRFKEQIARQQQYGGPWKDDPGGMITKCVEADALRSAFPTMLAGLYMREEITIGDSPSALASVSTFQLPASTSLREEYLPTSEEQAAAAKEKAADTPKADAKSEPKENLGDFVTNAGFTFDHFRKLCEATGTEDDPSSWGGFEEVPAEIAEAALRNKRTLLSGLNTAKGVAAKGAK